MRILLATTFNQCQELGLHLEAQKYPLLGLDTEKSHTTKDEKVDLLQLASVDTCYLFQIGPIYRQNKELPSVIDRILSNPEIVKVGVSLDLDAELLFNSYGYRIRSGIDLQAMGRTLGDLKLSLQDLGTKYIPNFEGKDPLGHKGDWSSQLTPLQQHYAAMDAWHCLFIYQGMLDRNILQAEYNFEDSEEELYLIWVKSYLQTLSAPIKLTSLLNYTLNSYAPWRKRYLEDDRRQKAVFYLAKFTSILPYDQSKSRFIPMN